MYEYFGSKRKLVCHGAGKSLWGLITVVRDLGVHSPTGCLFVSPQSCLVRVVIVVLSVTASGNTEVPSTGPAQWGLPSLEG